MGGLPFLTSQAFASHHDYAKRKINQQIVHIVTISPKNYVAEIVKSNDGALGRETVDSVAKRSGALVAINDGFFEMGDKGDGKETGTLVIKGHQYKVKNQTQALVVINDGNISIVQSNPKKHLASKVSIVSAIPLLIKNAKLVPNAIKKSSEFMCCLMHARLLE